MHGIGHVRSYCDLWPGYHASAGVSGGVSGGFIHSGNPDEAAIGCWTPNDGFALRMSNTGEVFPQE